MSKIYIECDVTEGQFYWERRVKLETDSGEETSFVRANSCYDLQREKNILEVEVFDGNRVRGFVEGRLLRKREETSLVAIDTTNREEECFCVDNGLIQNR